MHNVISLLFTPLRTCCQVGRRGTVLVLIALAAPVMIIVLGLAVDYAYASYVNQRLARAGDAAVLAAVSQTAATMSGGYSNTASLQSYGNSVFNETIKPLGLSNVNWTLTVTQNSDNSVTASGNYSYSAPTFFSSIVGRITLPTSGALAATVRPLTYVNYYIVVDASQSMGIAATATDMQNLYNRVVLWGNGSDGEAGCVFGCHEKRPGQKYTNEWLAHSVSPSITLRIDSAVSAIQNIVNDASTAAGSNKNIRFALYVIQANPNDGTFLKQVQVNGSTSPSSDYANILSAAATIDLGSNQIGGIGDSDFVNELSTFNTTAFANNSITANGSGASATSPINYVFLITDGVTDTRGSCNGSGHCTSAFDPNRCTQLKSKAIVGVIYTTYLPVYNYNNSSRGLEGNYAALVNPFVNNIPANLQSCATSSDYYFEAVDGPALNSAMSTLFAKTLPISARLTQ